MKRIIDIIVSMFGLLLFSPILLFCAVIIRLFIGKSIIFRQIRPGLNEKPFTIYKFRTMVDKYGADNQLLLDGERLTRIGSFLRKTSLDELPELFNVLKGNMSLVGPRPLLMKYLPFFTEREKIRFLVHPGITGWAQINGRNEASWNDRLSNDVWYVEKWNLRLDMKIIWRTIMNVFRRRGVIVDARSIMLNLDEERKHKNERQYDSDSSGQ